jgi:hypothetical protein
MCRAMARRSKSSCEEKAVVQYICGKLRSIHEGDSNVFEMKLQVNVPVATLS